MRKISILSEIDKIADFIKRKFSETGRIKAIIGLSGGIDSAVSAALCVKALGKENVFGLMMPYKKSSKESLKDAIAVKDFLRIETQQIDISPMIDAYFDNYEPQADLLRRGNRMARERMCILFDYSAKLNGLVVGTGNKTEILIGYFTQHGDGACAFEPIGNLYKTEVRQAAKILGLPSVVIEKKPTADLWNGQTDEDEIGLSYDLLDDILFDMVEDKRDEKSLLSKYKMNDINRVRKLYERSAFKRELPEIPALSSFK
ncbi:MAG: NAD+ synthase [Candidatus Cloacimonetes bacterium]|nr:NAD+ synthase [Candidatus Cloacimonadota bacterium]